MRDLLFSLILSGKATLHSIPAGADRKQQIARAKFIKDMELHQRRAEQLKAEMAIVEEKARKAAEQSAKIAATKKRESDERAVQVKVWEEISAVTVEEKQATCVHSDVWGKNQLRKKFMCSNCSQKRGVVSFQCSFCNLLACQVCVNKFREEKRHAAAGEVVEEEE